MKKIIKTVTNNRGFLTNLFDVEWDKYQIIYSKNSVYETNNVKHLILSKLIRNRILDYLGVFQIIKNIDSDKVDAYFSYNRFCKIEDKPYIIYLENPLALVHYSTYRPKHIITKSKLKKEFKNSNLKEIVCMSKSCENSFFNIYDVPKELNVQQIYPLIPDYDYYEGYFKEKSQDRTLNCLYISSSFYLKGGSDIVKSFQNNNNKNIHLTIVTKINSINKKDIDIIKGDRRITLLEFKLNKVELDELYNNSHLLLHPTRQDSLPLVVLEAIKRGLVVLGSDLCFMREMVKQGENGFLCETKYKFYLDNGMPNEEIWNNRKKTIYSQYNDDNIIHFLDYYVNYFYSNRDELCSMMVNAHKLSIGKDFGERSIIDKWNNIFERTV